MSIDINPSFEVGLDENLQVISLEALNDEAKILLEAIPDWKNSTLDSITEEIIEHSKDSGYLKDGKQVLITTVVTDSHDTEVDRELEQGIKEIKEEYKKEQIAVTSITSTVETRKAAQEKGISTGKLLIEEDKIPKPVQEKPVEQEKKNQQEKAVEQKEINEFRNNQKQKAEEVQEELKEKKEQIKEKVKNNIENSNMPAHLKEKKIEKIEEKWEKKQQKQEEKERKNEEREQRKENNNRGKDRNHDDDDD